MPRFFRSRTSATAVALAMVAAVVIGVWVGGAIGSSETTTTAPDVIGAQEDLADLPSSHPAVQILADGYTSFDTFSEEARRLSLEDYICARSLWELCMVWSDGVLAVVPFGNHNGVAEVSAQGLSGPVQVPLDIGRPVGLTSSGSAATAIIMDRLGTEIGRAEIETPRR